MSDNSRADLIGLATTWVALGAAKMVAGAHLLGINTWGEASAAAVFFYTSLCALSWFLRNFWRPLFGWLRRRRKAGREV